MKHASAPAFSEQTRQALLAIAIIAIAGVGVTLPGLASRATGQPAATTNINVLKVMAQGL